MLGEAPSFAQTTTLLRLSNEELMGLHPVRNSAFQSGGLLELHNPPPAAT
jgi:hypothetical protein